MQWLIQEVTTVSAETPPENMCVPHPINKSTNTASRGAMKPCKVVENLSLYDLYCAVLP